MNITNQNFASIDEMRRKLNRSTEKTAPTDEKVQHFGQVFQETKNQVRFSKHAERRLETRNISMSEEQRVRLNDATNQALQKGMKEPLVMVDDLAFIVNVRNKMVVTAVNDTERAVFTNIDGAIIN